MSGAGDTITPMIISLVTTVAIRVPLAYTIAHFTKSETLPNSKAGTFFAVPTPSSGAHTTGGIQPDGVYH